MFDDEKSPFIIVMIIMVIALMGLSIYSDVQKKTENQISVVEGKLKDGYTLYVDGKQITDTNSVNLENSKYDISYNDDNGAVYLDTKSNDGMTFIFLSVAQLFVIFFFFKLIADC